jgi:hypothetical protein
MPLGGIISLQTQSCNQNKNWIVGSGDVTKKKGMLSNLHNHIFGVHKD